MGESSPDIGNRSEAFSIFSYLPNFSFQTYIPGRRPRHIHQPRTKLTSHLCPPSSPPQIARAKQIKSHFLQKTATEHSDARKANEESAKGVIVSLGLIKGEEGDDK
jgi:hypothetical protein